MDANTQHCGCKASRRAAARWGGPASHGTARVTMRGARRWEAAGQTAGRGRAGASSHARVRTEVLDVKGALDGRGEEAAEGRDDGREQLRQRGRRQGCADAPTAGRAGSRAAMSTRARSATRVATGRGEWCAAASGALTASATACIWIGLGPPFPSGTNSLPRGLDAVGTLTSRQRVATYSIGGARG